MPTDIRVPQMGESVTEGVIAQWLKAEGDSVSADEPVVEVETDKITIEVPAPSNGVLRKQSAGEGDTVSVGDVIGEIEEGAGEQRSSGNGQSQQAQPQTAQTQPQTEQPREQARGSEQKPAPAPSQGDGEAGIMPAAAAEAKRQGIDPSTVEGTGRGGRVLKEDVMRAASGQQQQRAEPARQQARPQPQVPQVERPISEREVRKKMTPLRKRVAERLVESQNTAAILTTFNEIDMTGVVAMRKRWKDEFVEQHGVKLGFMSFFVKAAVDALKAFPAVNSEIDGEEIVYKHYYDIGVAVGGGKGLVVPVIRDADRLSSAEIEKQIGDLGKRAKDNKLTLEDLTGGTFTISNGGVYGSMMSTPILNPPQTGILGLHNIVERPIAVDGKVEIRPVMYIALSYDHRVIDGREAVQFLVRIKTLLEDPERLFLGV